MSDEPFRWLRTTQAAPILGVSISTIIRLARNGRLPAVKSGHGRWLFRYDQVYAFKEEYQRWVKPMTETREILAMRNAAKRMDFLEEQHRMACLVIRKIAPDAVCAVTHCEKAPIPHIRYVWDCPKQ